MVGQLTVIGCSQEASKDVKVGRWQRPLELLTTTLSHQGLQLDFRAGSLVVKSCTLGRHWAGAPRDEAEDVELHLSMVIDDG
jgi:hypothetical protein